MDSLHSSSVLQQSQDVLLKLQRWLGKDIPEVAMILGSGLRSENLALSDTNEIDTAELGLAVPKIEGHESKWIVATLGGKRVLIAGGRSHAYEGISLGEATLGVRAVASLGCQSLVVTNAAGGIRPGFMPGTLMAIRDHINLLGRSPLVGPHYEDFGARFVDMSEAYSASWNKSVQTALSDTDLTLEEGVYAACLGPQYETPTEVKMLGILGADAVGMSTVPEVIVANQVGLNVFGLSLITNQAAGISPNPLNHQEVVEEGAAAASKLAKLLEIVVELSPEG